MHAQPHTTTRMPLRRFAVIQGILRSDALGLNYVRRSVSKQRAKVERGELGV